MEGTGRWTLAPAEGGTLVRYDWDIRTTRWWMNLLAPVARPAFQWVCWDGADAPRGGEPWPHAGFGLKAEALPGYEAGQGPPGVIRLRQPLSDDGRVAPGTWFGA
jgi:hypothetical protein